MLPFSPTECSEYVSWIRLQSRLVTGSANKNFELGLLWDFCGSKSEWAALFILGRDVHNVCSPRFTSGATPADLFVASTEASQFFLTCVV